LEGLRRRWLLRATVLALLFALPVGYSLIRWRSLSTRPAARVLVVQPNIPEDLKLEREAAVDSSRRALAQLTGSGLARSPDVELVVWPETALPTSLEWAPDWGPWVAALARSNNVTLLFGLLDVVRYADGGYDYFNAALFVDTEGSPASIYRKHYLVPIIERVPFVPVGWVRSLRSRAIRERWRLPLVGNVNAFLRYFGGFGRGAEEPVLRVNDAGFGVLICYESIFPALSRKYRREGADFLVNITNDAWFGRERPWWSRTSALYQHPAHLVMRAIENRMGVARAANTGISLFVDPRGRIREPTPLFEPASRVSSVETTDGMTLYTRLGDWPGWLCALGAAFLLLWSWWRERRRAGELT
jgi:apolipoprotein N-acyltransferase